MKLKHLLLSFSVQRNYVGGHLSYHASTLLGQVLIPHMFAMESPNALAGVHDDSLRWPFARRTPRRRAKYYTPTTILSDTAGQVQWRCTVRKTK